MSKAKRIILISLGVLLSLMLIAYVAFGLFAPIKWESFGCQGGFETFLKSMCLEAYEDITDEIVSETERTRSYAEYGYRTITCHFSDDNGTKLLIHGKKIWYDHYTWKIEEVT